MSKFLALKGISTNFTPYSGDIATGLKYNNSVDSSRKQIIKIIQDFISNDSFEHYYYRWYCSENSSFDLEEINKLHNPYGWMTKVIKELVLLAPMIGKDGFTTTVKKKQDVLYSALDQMNWNILNEEIDETCETKGDFFSYWYYEQDNFFRDGWKEIITTDGIVWENPIPRVKVLESENMKDITYDSNYNVTGYVYEQDMVNERINDSNGQVTYEMYKVTMIFKKGFIKVIDPVNYPEKGYKIFLNKEWEKDIIRVIHVPSFKKQRDKFSYIPAIDYLDSILLLDDKTTILSMINKYHGFPVNWTVDLRIDWDNSSVMPGGVVRSYTEYDPECNNNTH